MNNFVHRVLGHFYMNEADGEGGDLGGGDDAGEQDDQGDDSDNAGDDDQGDDAGDDDDSVVVTIGDEKPPVEDEEEKNAPQWVKKVRTDNKEKTRRIRELEQELAATKAVAAPKVPELGPKPTLEDSDWDAEDFEAKLDDWKERKRKIDQVQDDERKQQEAQQKEWQDRLDSYGKAKTELKVRDFDSAESAVMAMFDQTQQGIIIDVMDNPALMVYALGTNPKAAERLAAIKKPTKFLRELSRMEDKELKVNAKKNAPPPPEGKVRSGTAAISGSVDSNLDRLRAEAEKSGDNSKVLAYKRAQREKQKA